MTGVTVNYANRQVDVELLQSIVNPGAEQSVQVTTVGTTPKLVTGVQKAVQRYTVLLLTTLGDVHFDTAAGGTLLVSLLRGIISNEGYLSHLFGVANASALRMLAVEDADERFGVTPDDEQIVGAVLDAITVDYATGTVSLEVALTTAAGDNFAFIVPISTAR